MDVAAHQVAVKVAELQAVAAELGALDDHRVELGARLVDLEHWFRRVGCAELSDSALEVFTRRYVGRACELADGLRE
ncbi:MULTISPECIES: hypothetical protein [Nocardiaceae]|uniref:Uncharacterized protein n=1 Tax=Rhodococcoides kroppenstedtii TaxID=293050 RepID=A0ABS7NWX0_9NOCA|nr:MULTISPECIES: hypothetical protein [Rhodococcus]AMY19961.1 hypothetical protein A3Q40_02593 [Rhodococcus sp. PBTS 1]MBY6314709.1 hypothetical protein [Rhodococcus kroppenstedtii]MBY6322516.1 hypothetical protein [Rhodococcus kroppenstedtii]MBY6401320.1 hypothetical protein [Rhodococcus kroppenstedtii]